MEQRRRARAHGQWIPMGACVLAGIAMCQPAAAQPQPPAPATTATVAGVTTFHQVSPTVALSGAVPPDAMASLAAHGVKTVIVVRTATEPGYDAAATEAAARGAGLEWVAIPFTADAPDKLAVDRVLETLARPGAGSTVIVCRTGQRAALMWYARRVLVDGWDEPRAMEEAVALGLVRDDLKAFARTYVQERARRP